MTVGSQATLGRERAGLIRLTVFVADSEMRNGADGRLGGE